MFHGNSTLRPVQAHCTPASAQLARMGGGC